MKINRAVRRDLARFERGTDAYPAGRVRVIRRTNPNPDPVMPEHIQSPLYRWYSRAERRANDRRLARA